MEAPKDIIERVHGLKLTHKSGHVNAMGCPVVGLNGPMGGTPGINDESGLVGKIGQTIAAAGQAAMNMASGVSSIPILTNNFGNIIPDATHCLQIAGHPVVSDVFLMEKQQMFNRSKILERAVHACGSGAFGQFVLEKDMSQYTKAKLLGEVGKSTPIAARFSTTTYGREFPDSARNPRGLAFKFYTEEGNYDILSINFPVFFCRDPMLGPDVIRTQQRNPENFLLNYDAMFDFMSLVPESMHANTWFWSDHGTPVGWRFMDGFPCHTFRWVNANGESFYVKYRFKTDQGIKNFPFDEAQKMCGQDPDFAKRDLFQTINSGGVASWQWCVQIMPANLAATYTWDPFDNTKVWSEKDFPWIPVGKLVFNRNPENFHRDIEQLAFSPGRLIPGIEPSPDPLLQFRLWFYLDAQLHRLGTNYHQIPVNCPFRSTNYHSINRDGDMRVDTNGGCEPHYVPNSHPPPIGAKRKDPYYDWAAERINGTLERKSASKHEYKIGDDYIQPREFYITLSTAERHNLHKNIAAQLVLVSSTLIQKRWLVACYLVHPDYANGILSLMPGTTISLKEIDTLATSKNATSDPTQAYLPLM